MSGFPPRARVKSSGRQAEMDELRREHWLLRSREGRNSPHGTRYRASEGRVRAAVKAHGGQEDSSHGFSTETVSRRSSRRTCSPRRSRLPDANHAGWGSFSRKGRSREKSPYHTISQPHRFREHGALSTRREGEKEQTAYSRGIVKPVAVLSRFRNEGVSLRCHRRSGVNV
jgi:hypothetical protein